MTVDLEEGPSTSRAARFLSRPSSDDGEAAGMPNSTHPLLGPKKHEVYDSTPLRIDTKSSMPDDNTPRAIYPPTRLSHTPIPATQVFSRSSPPLFLPNLDDYLASLPMPYFRTRNQKDKQPVMFPPFGSLSSSGLTLEDLELNKPPPSTFDRASILSSIVSIFLGVLGSSAVATYYSLQGLANTVQLFALILSTLLPFTSDGNQWSQVILGTIPNVLALNFASSAVQSLIFLIIFIILALLLLYHFYVSSRNCERYNRVEGLQRIHHDHQHWTLVITTFLLTVIYLPLSTLALHVLVWSQDLWVVPNPYTNVTTSPPVLPPLGPAAEYRDPLDFCWTTTMKRNEINFAPAVIMLSGVVFISFTVWFPLALHRVIQQAVPKVDPYTELGRPRNAVELDLAYHHLVTRDSNPFAFLYSGFRRGWGSYQAIYLFAKLSTLLIVAVIDPDNCLFRSFSHPLVALIRQVLLLASTLGFFLAQCFFAPFLDPVPNASEWVSRLNYVSTSLLALLVALNVPGSDILNTYVLYIIYVVTYGLSFYFTLINLEWMHKFVKRLTRRIDFSIDIFSPRLDISSTSAHTKRRIWQETLSALFLTDKECKIPNGQTMTFAQARDSVYPPYLLDFTGSPGARHVENLKILREVGNMTYHRTVSLMSGPDSARYKQLEEDIQRHFVGPDCYWKDPKGTSKLTSNFGNAWWIPFPPTLVIKYDEGPYAVLQDFTDLRVYVVQNSSREVKRKREIRLALRCLEYQRVIWPYDHITPVGSQSLWCCKRGRYEANSSIHYNTGILHIIRQGHLSWQELSLGSGFKVELEYAADVKVNGETIGLNDDFEPTSPLVRFLASNRDLIVERLGQIEAQLESYRHHHRRECQRKRDVLSYSFLSTVFERPQEPSYLIKHCTELESDVRVHHLLTGNVTALSLAYERFSTVSANETATWWYIFWDDLWRQNHTSISGLQTHASDFNPYYPTSIAYTPLPRPALETFLIQRGLMSKVTKRGDFVYPGLLNKIYLRLNETVFRKSSGAVYFHLGYDASELDMSSLDEEEMVNPSGIGTGGGTDHDNSIIPRPAYRWEGLLEDPLRKSKRKRRRFFAKLGAWTGITPLWKSEMPSQGVSVDLRLENGRYVLLDEMNV